jgi:hypothetical protein
MAISVAVAKSSLGSTSDDCDGPRTGADWDGVRDSGEVACCLELLSLRADEPLARRVREIENLFIPLSDGSCLAARIFLPEDAETRPVPAILEFLPYRKRDGTQPTVSRWENAPGLREVARLMRVMIDLYCASYASPPAAVTLDIDDTVDVVHGHQQLSLFNAHYDERCFLPIHVYDTATSRPVAVLLRPGKTPSGCEVRGHLRRLVRQIRRHWPATRLTIRGDGHYGRPVRGRPAPDAGAPEAQMAGPLRARTKSK